ncbi:HPr family phosphocarrier protein [Eubacterium limosum]|uniref:Phosphocarrier protein HPr n=1 Tax=Eubacterium limosum TaxID=1736 RepID=A0ABT5UM37_EUBLI|nr:HPr family phosphocarrier protein [Eubacterium limosum]MCB6568230.1 HPr family phosphocarrier protein [Eubacterium limosum]MDE1469983.1 HPr family phosphocarrier protein [Eubacterium limosum]
MYTQKLTVVNPTGLHARPAAEFCKIAGTYQSKIMLKRLGANEKEGNGKSVIAVMAMGLPKGCEIEISAEGEDENAAVEALAELVRGGFGEI